MGQRPLLQGLGLALVLGGAGLGLAEPRWGAIEAPRLTVHVVLDATRSMLVPDCAGISRWQAATGTLERLWSGPNPGVRFSLQLLTGDAVPLMPPGEDQALLREAMKAVEPGAIGSPGTALGYGLTQAAAMASPGDPAILLLLSDGEETVEAEAAARVRAGAALRSAHLALYAIAFGQPQSQPVPGAPGLSSTARPDLLEDLARRTGGRVLRPGEDPAALFQALARGREPMPLARSLVPAHPEWGAWLALAGLALWLLAAGKPMRAWRPVLGLALVLGLARPARADLPLPQAVQAWAAQHALARGDLAAARRWRPAGGSPSHRLLAAQIDLRSGAFQGALDTLAPLTGPSAPSPPPPWRAPALLMAARAWMELRKPEAARPLLERILLEQPGHPEATHDLQTLLKDSPPPPPAPPKPPPPRPSLGASQDEVEGLRERLPAKTRPPAGVKDI